jgi:hypothetical protein
MAVLMSDADGPKDLNNVVRLKFVDATNPPKNERVVLDDQSSISTIAGINKVRAEVGNGDGSTGWVKVLEIPPAGSTREVHVQLSKVTGASILRRDGDQEFAVLERNGELLGEVHGASALEKVKTLFSP